MSIRGKFVLIGLACCLLLGLIASWGAGSLMTRGKSADIHPADAPARDLRLKTVDGVTLAATYWSGKKQGSGAILLLHGVDASRSAMEANAAWLASLGYAVLTIDFRGHGQSTMTGRSFGFHEAKDAQAAFDWLKRRQRGAPVAVIGISMGGAASLIGGRGPLPADALVLQAVYPDIRSAIRDRIAARLTTGPASLLEPLLSFQSVPRFGVWPSDISPIRAIKRFRGAVLVIGGKEDRYTPPDDTRALFEAAPGRKSLWLVPRADHVATSSLRDAYYRTRLKGFLEATIGLP